MRGIFGLCFLVFASIIVVSSLEEGSECTNFDGTKGICEVDSTCQWAKDAIKKKEITAQKLVRCGLKGRNTIICCKDTSVATSVDTTEDRFLFDGGISIAPVKTTTTTTTTTIAPTIKPVNIGGSRKSVQACEKIKNLNNLGFDYHIVNGEGADPGEFPHMCAIGYSDEVDPSNLSYDCGGSLISRNFVLTAAHCVNRRDRIPRSIKLGRVSLLNDDPNDEGVAQDILVKQVHLFPQYTSRKKYNDIALIEMEGNAQYAKNIKPACLYTNSNPLEKTQYLEITGWGIVKTDTREKSPWLMKAKINELPLEECNEIYQRAQIGNALANNLVKSQLCGSFKTEDGKIVDACQGDSGGPLQLKVYVRQESVFYIVGITSFGAGCASDFPGIYTRVSEYLTWIEGIVWPTTVEL